MNFAMSWRNLGRNPRRTLLALLGITVAQFTLIWMGGFINGYQAMIFDTLTGPMLGHVQLHALQYRDDFAIERVIANSDQVAEVIKSVPHVANLSARVYGPVLATVKELGHAAMVTGIDVAQETGPSGLLKGLTAAQLPGAQEVLVGKALAIEMGIHEGDSLALMGQAADGSVASGLYKVKGTVGSDIEQINRAGIVMNLKSAQELLAMDNQVHELTVHADSVNAIGSVVAALKQSELGALEIKDWKELMPQIAAYLDISSTMNLIILILVFLTTSAGIANTMVMATFERRHEFGMLLALGCKPSRLILILMLEAIKLGVMGVLLGSLLGALFVNYEATHGIWLLKAAGASGLSMSLEGMSVRLDIYPILQIADVGRGIVAVIATCVIASLWPARRISRLDPVEAMYA